MEFKCIVIDDEHLARKGLVNFIKEIPFLNLVGIFSNPDESLTTIKEKNISLLFLDIQMPKMTGLDFLKSLPNPPVTIITTAYSNYALESFELNVIDYLVKPIPYERFVKAVHKAKDYLEMQAIVATGESTDYDYFFIKCETRYEKIFFDDLLFVEALQNYVVLHTATRRFVSYLTFKSVEDYLPKNEFLKVHKSYIVSISKIDNIDGTDIKIGEHTIGISRTNKDEILNSILKNKLLKR